MEASSVRASPRKANSRLAASIQSLDADLLCKIFASLDHFDLVRCSAVCKSWNYAVWTSSLLKDLFCKKHRGSTGLCSVSVPWETSLKTCLEEFVMNQHRSSLLNGSVEAHRWNSHTVGVNQCRMKMGSIVTGVGDKVLRMWSSESYKCLGEYSIPNMASLVDFDFKRARNPYMHLEVSRQKKYVSFERSYIDPEAVIGCEDGTARVFDMYSQRCSRIIRMHSGPITCLALTDELILSGSSLGSITVAGLSSDQRVACLKSSTAPTGIRSLCFNPRSHLVFAGSTAGYSHCWDLRTMRPLWERRISPNVIYSMQYMQNDTSTLVVGGIDGVLRILDQNTGKFLAGYVMDKSTTAVTPSCSRLGTVEKKKVKALPEDACIDGIPRHLRPPITCVGVGMKKVVTTHNGKYIMMWKFKN